MATVISTLCLDNEDVKFTEFGFLRRAASFDTPCRVFVFESSQMPLLVLRSSLVMLLLFLTAASALAAVPVDSSPSAVPVSSSAPCTGLLQQTFLRLQDEKPQSLCQYSGKVVVVVNTASFCGFTPQYEGLEALSKKYKDRGLVVLGFPSNDFAQEKASNKEIAAFCENTFGVKFPMFSKTTVSGKDINPLFKQLAVQTGTPVRWNFYKYVIARNGITAVGFDSSAAPDSSGFVKEIEKQLAVR